MKLKYISVAVLAGTWLGADSSAQDPTKAHLHNVDSTLEPVHRDALHRGAVYELKLRVPWSKVDTYLSQYARWYLAADTTPGSGRTLIDILLREHGDHYNLVFLYLYDSKYKEGYYCNYLAAFYKHHAKDREFVELHNSVAKTASVQSGQSPSSLKATMDSLEPLVCTVPPIEASEVVRSIDSRLRDMVELNEGSWNFGVNACRLWKLHSVAVQRATPPADCPLSALEKMIK